MGGMSSLTIHLIIAFFVVAGFLIYQFFIKQMNDSFAKKNTSKGNSQDERHHQINLASINKNK